MASCTNVPPVDLRIRLLVTLARVVPHSLPVVLIYSDPRGQVLFEKTHGRALSHVRDHRTSLFLSELVFQISDKCKSILISTAKLPYE